MIAFQSLILRASAWGSIIGGAGGPAYFFVSRWVNAIGIPQADFVEVISLPFPMQAIEVELGDGPPAGVLQTVLVGVILPIVGATSGLLMGVVVTWIAIAVFRRTSSLAGAGIAAIAGAGVVASLIAAIWYPTTQSLLVLPFAWVIGATGLFILIVGCLRKESLAS